MSAVKKRCLDLDAAVVRRHFSCWSFPLTLSGLAAGFQLLGPQAGLIFRYDRQAILSGEIWRLFTGHLIHVSWMHLIMNLAALALFWGYFGIRQSMGSWIRVSSLCAAGIGIGLLVFDPGIAWYVGLSGLLHGLFTYGAVLDISGKRLSGWIWLVLISAKIGLEQLHGALSSNLLIGAPVLIDAHLYGAISGLLVAIMRV